MQSTVDVLVVGGGPSGLTVAAEVARTGARVMVVEKRTSDPIPRAGTVLPRPLELFDSRGIADRFIAKISEFNPHPFQPFHVWAGMHPVNWSGLDTRFGFTLYLSQHETELILRDWAQECGAEVLFQHELVGLEDVHGDLIRATVRSDGHDHTVEARYVVGADGGRSTVRHVSGIAMAGRDATFTGVIATANLNFPWVGSLRVAHNENGWCASFPFGAGLTRFTYVHAEQRNKTQNEPVTLEEIGDCIADILGERVEIPSRVSAARYGDAHKVADRFSVGRVFLVGEAVRIHYPASGVGMNFCVQDAFNLGWKLGAVLNGSAGPALLDTYESERRIIVDDLMASVDAQVSVQFDFSPRGQAFQQMFERNVMPLPDVTRQLCRQLNGLTSSYPRSPEDHSCVGMRVPDFEIRQRDGSSTWLYELLRTSDWVVLDLSGYEAVDGAEVENLPARVVAGFAGARPDWLRDAAAIIVRPDSYLAWASESPPQVGEVKDALLRSLHRI